MNIYYLYMNIYTVSVHTEYDLCISYENVMQLLSSSSKIISTNTKLRT